MQKRNKQGKIIKKKPKSIAQECIVDECQECTLHDGAFCNIYSYPSKKWKLGKCPMMTESKFKRTLK